MAVYHVHVTMREQRTYEVEADSIEEAAEQAEYGELGDLVWADPCPEIDVDEVTSVEDD